MRKVSSRNLTLIIAEGTFPNPCSRREREQLISNLSALVSLAKREAEYELEDARVDAENFIQKLMLKT